MSFETRHLDLTFKLGKGTFGDSGFDTVKLTGLRARANIQRAGGVSMSALALQVFGMDLSTMNQLSTLGKPLMDSRNNEVTVVARGDEGAESVVFIGNIAAAWVDASGAPDVVFQVQAFVSALEAMRPLPPSSYPGPADAAVIVASLAQQMGWGFENGGVQVTLSRPYYAGTGRQQVEACAREGDFNFFFDDGLHRLAIWPKDGTRGGEIAVVSPETGMVGYPAHTDNGILLTTLFNPTIQFGAQIEVRSVLLPAAGRWTVLSVNHDLEAEVPGGRWFTALACSTFGRPAIV